MRKQLSRSKERPFFAQLPVCRMGLDACGRAHYWGRELQKLGHDVRLRAVQLSKPYWTKPKNDRNDAEAICEAVSRPQMRFVPSKTVEQQAVLTVHGARELLVSERTVVANQVGGLLLEYGIGSHPGYNVYGGSCPPYSALRTRHYRGWRVAWSPNYRHDCGNWMNGSRAMTARSPKWPDSRKRSSDS